MNLNSSINRSSVPAVLGMLIALVTFVFCYPVFGTEVSPACSQTPKDSEQTGTDPVGVFGTSPAQTCLAYGWTTHRDDLHHFSVSHPSFLKKTDLAGALYAAVGAASDAVAVALVINRGKREVPPSDKELKDSVDESLQGMILLEKRFSTLSLGGSPAFVSEVLYRDSDEKWFSLIASFHSSGYHYTIAVQASPVPDERLRDDIRRAVLSFSLDAK